MLHVPKMATTNAVITILRPERATLVTNFFLRNQDYFREWFPERNNVFFTTEYWQARIEKSYQLFLDDKELFFSAMTPDEQTMIAFANFSSIQEGAFKGCYLRFALDQNFQGQGLMQEILCNTLNYIFCELDLHRVMANYPPANQRAEHLLTRLGFKIEGYARSYMKLNGQWQDHVLTSLINPLHDTEFI
ncbi:MAG: [Ribosomal protein S5]-alanine N-acetyltransferase [Candidatus Celerinatantimonas neptuna]|nr:MAG: [Ribosomal protein S5]-alanine N-acetyltransferase [Candidatus Celerinatantimonas neptuna]